MVWIHQVSCWKRYKQVIRKMKKHKSPGIDNIAAEKLQLAAEDEEFTMAL